MSYRSLSGLLLAAVVAAVFPAGVSAETNAEYASYASELADLQKRINELEAQQKDYPYQTSGNMPYQTSSPKDYWPSYALLEADGCPAWLASVDVLYWAVRNPNTQYGITDIGGVQDRGAVGEVLSIDPEYEVGYRIAVGKRLGHCATGPELTFSYTGFDQLITEQRVGSLRSSFISSDNSENDDSDNINTLGVETITPDDRATGATASYDFQYKNFDLEMAQALVTTEHLVLRVGGTGRFLDVDQDYRVTYTGGDFQVPFSPFETSDYVGGGLLIGTELKWRVTSRLSFDVGANAGAMFGRFDTRTFIPDDEPGVPTDVRSSERRMTTVLEMNAGLTYRRPVGRFVVTGSAGYEMTQLLDFNDHRTFTDSHMEGQNVHQTTNISLDGFYGRAGVEF